MEQCLFEGFKLKQKEIVLGSENSLSLFGSILLGNKHNSSCHWRCFEDAELEGGLQLVNEVQKMLPNDV